MLRPRLQVRKYHRTVCIDVDVDVDMHAVHGTSTGWCHGYMIDI